MARVNIRANGLQELQQRLLKMKENYINALTMELLQLMESSITYSKENKGYQDRTANLKNSISGALYLDGEPVSTLVGRIPQPTKNNSQNSVEQALNDYAQKDGVVAHKGYTIIIVAGMNYGKYVEDRGYNVLHLTKFYLRDEMKRIFDSVMERLRNS
jgi:hypothetical protein